MNLVLIATSFPVQFQQKDLLCLPTEAKKEVLIKRLSLPEIDILWREKKHDQGCKGIS